MALYLIKDEDVIFKMKGGLDGMSELFPLTYEPIDPECEDSKEYSKIIASKATGGLSDQQVDFKLARELKAFLKFPKSASEPGLVRIWDVYRSIGSGKWTSTFESLFSLFSKENLSFHLIVKGMDLKYSCGCASSVNLELTDFSDRNNTLDFNFIKLPEHERHPNASIKACQDLECRMTLSVSLTYGALARVPLSTLGDNCGRLLNEAVGSDLVVVAANGAEIKCHKCVLMMSCDYFRAMFESNMKEETCNRLELPDMSEAGVRAFLNFIYSLDMRAASESCDIALELFRAGDKYQMSSLKNRVKMLIRSKPSEWFSVGMAVRLSLLVQNMKEKEEILQKTAKVLKWYSKNSFAEMLASEEYEELFQNQVGKELFGHFLKFT